MVLPCKRLVHRGHTQWRVIAVGHIPAERAESALAKKGLHEVQKDLIARRVTVEGFRTAKAVRRLSGDLELPILQGVYRVIYEQRDPELNARELIELLAA